MYLALKNALGKSFILFRGLLNEFSGASAAYSFRNLNNAYAGPIVEVRRDIDTNTGTNERDFSIGDFNQVADWVNGLQETTLPANVASSAAAYSLRKVNSSYSGDVVRIRRASDSAEVNVGFDSDDKVSTSSPITQTDLLPNKAGTILFDGVDDDIDVNTALLPATDDFTLTIKVYVESNPSADATIFGQGTSTGDGRTVIQIKPNGTLFSFTQGIGGLTTGNSFNLGAINTIVFSRSGTTLSLKLNEGTAVTRTSSDPIQQTNSQIADGYVGDNFEGWFQSLSVGTLTWDGTQGAAQGFGWTINGSPQLSVVVPATLGAFLTEDQVVFQPDYTTDDGIGFLGNMTSDLNQTVGGRDAAVKFSVVSTGSNAVHRGYLNLATPLAGTDGVKVTLQMYRPSGGSSQEKLGFSFQYGSSSDNPSGFLQNSQDDTWEDFSFFLNGRDTSNRLYHQLSSTDGVGVNGYLFNGTTGDHIFIRNLKVEQINQGATVHTWYDQSGNAKDATQDASGEQPKIAEAGNIVTRLGQTSIDFTTSKTFLENSSVSITETEVSYFSVWQPAKDGATATEAKNRTLFAISSNGTFIQTPNTAGQMQWRRFGTTNAFSIALANLNTPNLHTAIGTSSGANYYFNSSSIYSDSLTGSNTTRTGLRIGTRILVDSHQTTGYISEFLIYNSDQSSNRFRIESNINNYYGIYTTENNGFVSKWYDQSGNNNNAVQTTGGDQPVIVSSGTLITDTAGRPAVSFGDGTDFLQFTQTTLTNETIFCKSNALLTNAFSAILSGADNRAVITQASSNVQYNLSAGNFKTISGSHSSGNQVFTFMRDGTNVSIFQNSSAKGTSTELANSSITREVIGRRGDTEGAYTGTIGEYLLYPTARTSDRADIEANIKSHYNIS